MRTSEPLLAHAVMISEDHLKGEPFVMYLGDNPLKQSAKPLTQSLETRCDYVIGAAEVEDPSRYGTVAFNEDGGIGDHLTLLNIEMENSIVMTGARIDCGKKITDS